MKNLILCLILLPTLSFAMDYQIIMVKKDGSSELVGLDRLIPLHRDSVEKLLEYYDKEKPPSSDLKLLVRIEENHPEKLEYTYGYHVTLKKG